MPRNKHYLSQNWNHQTLETLLQKKVSTMNKGNNSQLVVTCNNLHKKVLKDFTIEDLRVMIGQSIGTRYLMPLALSELEKDIMAEGDFYEGDLLKSVLQSDAQFWKAETEQWRRMVDLFEMNREKVMSFETSQNIREGLLQAFADFKKLYS